MKHDQNVANSQAHNEYFSEISDITEVSERNVWKDNIDGYNGAAVASTRSPVDFPNKSSGMSSLPQDARNDAWPLGVQAAGWPGGFPGGWVVQY